jgi:hypothetical protein
MWMRQANKMDYFSAYDLKNFGTASRRRRVRVYNAQAPARKGDYNRITTARLVKINL